MKNSTNKLLIIFIGGMFLGGVSFAENETEATAVTTGAPAQPAAAPKPAAKKKAAPKKKKKVKTATTKTMTETTPVAASDKSAQSKSSLAQWLQKMKGKISKSQAKKSQLVAVAAVRGDKVEDSTPLYWKGKTTEEPINNEELKSFDEAIDLAINGDTENAKTKLNSFLSTYPKSAMVDDAQETLSQLQ